ncbi:MAG: hypothetical protein J2P37_03460 [Ktedonobacteraceae bacterium]|nr:hypothetical protein [Ktedonobacteraceae bacterium]MBO0789779.1 hypothetical protein [Ktedonobacteraceae bacterium]
MSDQYKDIRKQEKRQEQQKQTPLKPGQQREKVEATRPGQQPERTQSPNQNPHRQ